MKTFVVGLFAVVAISILFGDQAFGQINKPIGGFANKYSVPVKPQAKFERIGSHVVTKPSDAVVNYTTLGGLGIKPAERVNATTIQGSIVNTSNEALRGVNYTMSSWNGASWTQIGRGVSMTVPAGGSVLATGYVNTHEALRVKIDITGPRPMGRPANDNELTAVKLSKEANVRTMYMVYYTTGSDGQKWMVAFDGRGQNASTSWADATRIGTRLIQLGFETDLAKYNGGVLRARTGKFLHQYFNTRAEAEDFREELRTLARRDPVLFSRTTP